MDSFVTEAKEYYSWLESISGKFVSHFTAITVSKIHPST
jgi:hypothetical protein